MILTHLRNNLVGYVALAVALGTGTAYAAASIPNGSVTTAKLHSNAVTSVKVKDGSIKPKDLKQPTFVQSENLLLGTPPATADIFVVFHNIVVPATGRTSVTVFIPAIGGSCDSGNPDQPSIGLYIDNVPVPGTASTVPVNALARSVQLTATVGLAGGKTPHLATVGVTCSGASQPTGLNLAGGSSVTVIQAG
jgi:hypothetical protein